MPVVLLPNAEQVFLDLNGKPLAGGSVYMYVPNTSPPVFATTWKDINQFGANTNPIILDADGRAIIWGNGIYRQVVYDINGVLVWDEITSSPGGAVAGTLNFYDIQVFIEGVGTNNEIYPIINVVRPLTLPQGLPGSIFTVATLPTATTTYTLYKNTTPIGTIAFSTLGVPTVTFLSGVNFIAGDQFSLKNQASADATAAGIAFTFVFNLTV